MEKGISKHKTLLSFGHWKFTVVHLCRYAVQAKEDGEGDVFYCHFTGVRELEKGKNRCPSLGLGVGWSHSWVAPIGTQLWCLKRTLYRVSYRGVPLYWLYWRQTLSTESSVKQPRIIAFTDDDERRETKRLQEKIISAASNDLTGDCVYMTDRQAAQTEDYFFHAII